MMNTIACFKYGLNTIIRLIVVHGYCNPWMIQHMIVLEVVRDKPSDRLISSIVDGVFFFVVLRTSIVHIFVNLSNKCNCTLQEYVYHLVKDEYNYVKRNQLLILNYKC